VFGATIAHAQRLMHGKKSRIRINAADPIFAGLPEAIDAARYHSLVAVRETLPKELIVIAQDDALGEVMAVRHADYPVYGLQFHPESILTPQGGIIMRNFLSMEGAK
jgi:anthranilate synthase component 2